MRFAIFLIFCSLAFAHNTQAKNSKFELVGHCQFEPDKPKTNLFHYLFSCFPKKEQAQDPISFAGLSAVEILETLNDSSLFENTELGHGSFGITSLSSRYFTTRVKKYSPRGRYRGTYNEKKTTQERYVIKIETDYCKNLRLSKGEQSFMEEAQFLKKMLPSDYVIDLIAAGEDHHGNFFIITKYGGDDLKEALHELIFFGDLKKHVRILHKFLFATQADLVEAGISYLDWKLENIVLDASGARLKLKLIDFGLAESLIDGYLGKSRSGTPSTASPEVYSSKSKLGYNALYANSFSIGATAILFENQKTRGLVEAFSILDKNKRSIEAINYYHNILRDLASTQYLKDLLDPKPHMRLHYNPKIKSWIKKVHDDDGEDSEQQTYKIFNPSSLKYVGEFQLPETYLDKSSRLLI